MRSVEILKEKRGGLELSRGETGFPARGFSPGSIPDYQISAFLMAVYLHPMTEREMVALTDEMRQSRSVFDLNEFPARKVDKHSTGGIVAPALAAAGAVVPMISGRGLAHTGDTLDKLESITTTGSASRLRGAFRPTATAWRTSRPRRPRSS